MDNIRQSFAREGLIRPRDGRVLGGVFAGAGRRFGLDPWAARLVFIILMMIVPGSQILLYPLLWVLMPAEQTLVAAVVQPAAPSPVA